MKDKYLMVITPDATKNLKKQLSKFKTRELWDKLAKDLSAKLYIQDDENHNIDYETLFRPTYPHDINAVYLIYYDDSLRKYRETSENQFEKIPVHDTLNIPKSENIYIFNKKLGHFFLTANEYNTLNSGRALKYYMSISWNNYYDDMLAYCKKHLNYMESVTDNIYAHLTYHNFARLYYGKIFRQEYGINMFFAAVDFFMATIHHLVFFSLYESLDASPNDTTLNSIEKSMESPVSRFSEGYLLNTLQRIRKTGWSNILSFLKEKIVTDYIRKEVSNLAHTLTPETNKQKITTWEDLFIAMTTIKNHSKGHGILYSINEFYVQLLLYCSTALMEELEKIDLKFSHGKSLDTAFKNCPYIINDNPFLDINDEKIVCESIYMHYKKAAINLKDKIIYSDGTDYHLYTGYSSKLTHKYYKNYLTGVCVSRRIPTHHQTN